MIKAIIFDIGGVIATNIFGGLSAFFSKRYNVAPEVFRRAWKKQWHEWEVNSISCDEYWEGVLKELKIEEDSGVIMENAYEQLELNEKVMQLVRLLVNKYRLAIISNNTCEWGNYAIEMFGLEEFFDPIILSCDVGCVKPDKEIYKLTLEKLGVLPGECIFVDDKERNTLVAKDMGINVVLFENAVQLNKELIKLGVKTA